MMAGMEVSGAHTLDLPSLTALRGNAGHRGRDRVGTRA